MKIPYFCCIGAELKRYEKDFDFMNQVYLYKIPTDDTIEEVLAQDYFQAIADTVLQDDLLYIYEPTAQVLHTCRFNKQNGHITAVQLANNVPGLTPNRVLISDSTGHITAGDVTLEYLKNKVNLDGTSIMTGPLKMRSSVSFKCAIAPSWDGVGFYKLNDNDSVTLMASMEATDGLSPAQNNTYNIGTASRKWKDAYIGRVITAVLNNGHDIAVPVTSSADTLALKSEVDNAANSGRMITDQGVWFAKMYAGTTPPSADDGTNYADFSQTDGDGNPIIVIYERQSGAWVQTQTITPPANYDGYVPVTSKIWDIVEQTGQQGGRVLWNHQSKEFTPYPNVVSFDGLANDDLSNLSATGEARFTGKANTDLDNLTSTGKNIANWSSNVSNCITEIPQDIKLELNAGVLTLKAGSKVYVPNGAGVFDIRDITSDVTLTQGWGSSQTFLLVVRLSDGALRIYDTARCYSGTSSVSDGIYYNTNDNKVYVYDNGSLNYQASFPIAVITGQSPTITSIDQVFNGFGYIGSTVFALPGVKGLIPNGRNADGTLNNTVFTVSNVITKTTSYDFDSECAFMLRSNSVIDYVKNTFYLKSETTPPLNQYVRLHQTTENKCYYGEASGWAQVGFFVCGTMVLDSAGKITSFNLRFGFTAVDYNDIDSVIDYQRPTAANGYTWYRKYKSGWVEQGGQFTATSVADGTGTAGNNTINLPIKMANDRYWYSANTQVGGSGWDYANGIILNARAQTTLTLKVLAGTGDVAVFWEVKGMAA